MEKITFDEFVQLIATIPQPNQRLGIFNIKINNCQKRYEFHSLKVNYSNNPDVTGFGLNHYGWFAALPKQSFKRSRFHDEEDVSIGINRDEFEYAYKVENFNEIGVSCKTFTLQINWL